MSSHVRITLPALLALALALACSAAPGARAASFGVQSFEATVRGPGAELFVQAAGHPASLEVEFKMNREAEAPAGELQRFTLDAPPGFVFDPQAPHARCGASEFGADAETQCPPESQIGSAELTLYSAVTEKDVGLPGSVYDLVQPQGLPLELGIYTPAAKGLPAQHLLLQGHISPSDHHEYLQAQVQLSSALELAAFTATLEDVHAPALLTLPSACSSPMTWALAAQSDSESSEHASEAHKCEEEKPVAFAPQLASSSQTTASEQPTGISVTATLKEESESAFSADIADARIVLPAGLTLDPSALQTLQLCTAAQAAIAQEGAFSCSPASQIGSAAIATPILPEALSGGLYLAGEAAPISAAPGTQAAYPVYLEAENARYGTSVHARATLEANRDSGQLELVFDEAPQLPISELTIGLGGPADVLANPLSCAAGSVEAALTPYTTPLATPAPALPFSASGCPSSIPFDPAQGVSDTSTRAGAATSFSLTFSRAPGQQYISSFQSLLPKGLLPRLPGVGVCDAAVVTVRFCAEGAAIGSEVGVGSIEAGAGGTPVTLSGSLNLTSGYGGAPYGLALIASAIAGPLDLAEDPLVHLFSIPIALSLKTANGQLELEGSLPRVLGGVPLRVRSVSLTFDRGSFLYNPTACATYRTTSTLTGFLPGVEAQPSHALSSTSAISDCEALRFKPAVAASSNAKAVAAGGANLESTISVPAGDSSVRSLLLQLPRQMQLRQSTLANACPEATFRANSNDCPGDSFVGSASLSTPMLAGKLTGPAILVLHPQTDIPELFLVLRDGAVPLDLEGSFRVAGGLTFVAFSAPDMPISTLTLDLPSGRYSALSFVPRGGVCPLPLLMPVFLTAWNAKTLSLRTTVHPVGCGVRIVGHKVIGDVVYLTVQTFAAGRISGSGPDLRTIYRHLSSARRAVALLVPLSSRGRGAHRPLHIRVRVGFVPTAKGPRSSAYISAKFP